MYSEYWVYMHSHMNSDCSITYLNVCSSREGSGCTSCCPWASQPVKRKVRIQAELRTHSELPYFFQSRNVIPLLYLDNKIKYYRLLNIESLLSSHLYLLSCFVQHSYISLPRIPNRHCIPLFFETSLTKKLFFSVENMEISRPTKVVFLFVGPAGSFLRK